MTFLEYWKRKSASLSHHWDCMGFQEEEERPRPAFAAKAPYLEKNPITGIREPSFPQSKRYKRIAAGMGLIMFMVCDCELVIDRVWNSRGRAGSGFGQSGPGLGRVFANFESRVRVLHCRVSGFCWVSISCKKWANI